MDHDHFARKITAMQQRMAALQRRGAGSAGVPEEALEELQSSLEELLVTEEELRQQNEALGAAHLEIQAARDRYADLYNFAPVGYFTLAANGAIIEANLTGAGLLGVDRSSLLGTPLTRFVVKEDRERYAIYRVRLGQSEGPQATEVRLLKSGGVEFHARLEGLAAYDREGKFKQVKLTISDITERKRAEAAEGLYRAALQQRTRDLVLLGQASQILMSTLDPQEVTERLMEAITHTIGVAGSVVWLWDKEERGGLVCWAASQPDLKPALVGLRLRPGEGIAGWVAQSGQSALVPSVTADPRFSPAIDTETGFQTQSSLAVPLRVRARVIGALEVVNKLNSPFDLHDQTLLEALATSAAIALENAQLVETLHRQAIDLEARNEDLDTYAQTVAHDLNGPLSAVVTLSDLLVEIGPTLPAAELQEYLRAMAQRGRKVSTIIRELLLLAGVRQKEVELKPLPMASLVAEAQQRLADLIDEFQAKLTIGPAEWPVALGYGPWVEEVWVNYLSNAIQYGGQPPHLELGATEQPDGLIRFWVHDNGDGLTPKEQERLFKPFTRLNPDRSEGHGLGLSIVRRIVEKLGGQVGVESDGAPGRGSTFSFTLPGVGPCVRVQPDSMTSIR